MTGLCETRRSETLSIVLPSGSNCLLQAYRMSSTRTRSTTKKSKKAPPRQRAKQPEDSADEEDVSPERSGRSTGSTNDKLDLILSELKSMGRRMDSFEQSVGVMTGDIFQNSNRIDELEEDLRESEQKLEQAYEEIDRLENRHRENNARLLNVDEEAETVQGMIPFLVDFFKNECSLELREKDFEKAHRLGRLRADQKYPRAIIFKMHHFQRKCELVKAAKDSLKDGKYRLVPDMSDRLRRQRALFWPLREQLHAMDKSTYFKGPCTLHIEDGETTLKFDTMEAAKKGLRKKFPNLAWKSASH